MRSCTVQRHRREEDKHSEASEESNHIPGSEATSKLPEKLFEKPASESDPAARKMSFKGWHLGPVIAVEKGQRGRGASSLSGDYALGPLPGELDCEDFCLDS